MNIRCTSANSHHTHTFRGSCAGGKGVYTFSGLVVLIGSKPAAARSTFFVSSRSFLRAVFSEVLRCLRRNLGRKRSQDSFACFGSLASSRLIISSCSANFFCLISTFRRVGVDGGALLSDRSDGCSSCSLALSVELLSVYCSDP